MKWWSVALLICVTTLVFLPSTQNGFVNFDDWVSDAAADDPIRTLTPQSVVTLFTNPQAQHGQYKPLTLLSYAVEYHFFGLNPHVYHTTNLMLHVLNTLLVFGFIYSLCRSNAVAFTVAVLFAIHPCRVESVCWIAERKDLISSFFSLAALICYVRYSGGSRPAYYLTLLFVVLSFTGKTAGVTLPLLFIVIDYFVGRRSGRDMLVDKVPFFLVVLVFGIVSSASYGDLLSQGSIGANEAGYIAPTSLSLLDHVCIVSHVVCFYAVETLLPLHLSSWYPYPHKINHLLPYDYLLSPIALLGMAFLLWRRRNQTEIFGVLFFFLNLLPSIINLNVLPMLGRRQGYLFIAADHYTYLASIGLLFILVRQSKLRPALAVAVLVLVLTTFAALSVSRCQIWWDGVTYWTDWIRQAPEEGYPWYMRGLSYSNRGELGAAEADLEQAKKLSLGSVSGQAGSGAVQVVTGLYAQVCYSSGLLDRQKNDDVRALADFSEAIKTNPALALAYFQRGIILTKRGDLPAAVTDLRKALDLDPTNPDVFYYLGLAYLSESQLERAIFCFNHALALQPGFAGVYAARGVGFAAMGDAERAVSDFTHALELAPNMRNIYYNRSRMNEKRGAYKEALEDLERFKAMGGTVDAATLEQLRSRASSPGKERKSR